MTTNTIDLYAPEATTPFHTQNSSAITLIVDSSGAAWYPNASTGTEVEFVIANLDDDEMNITLTPASSALQIDSISGTPYPVTATVNAGVRWSSLVTSGGLSLVFTTPSGQYDQFDWTLGEGVPPVRLTVKIRRR